MSKDLLTPTQIAALKGAYNIYRKYGKVKRSVIEGIFWRMTGHKLGPMYHSIPIVRMLLDLAS